MKLFIGRWSPFHEGHKYIIDSFINNGESVCIAIRDTQLSEKDPFPTELRKKIIENYYSGSDKVKVIVIPDIDGVCVGRGVGYSIMQVPENIEIISGTKKRQIKESNFNDGKGSVFWFTGIPCSGKTTLVNILNQKIKKDSYIIDGDVFRKTVTPHLGFSIEDRIENIRTAARIAKVLKNHGLIVFCAFVSPLQKMRDIAREIIGDGFYEILVSCTTEECIKRDVKGMYRKALKGEIQYFTGLDGVYENSIYPDLTIDTEKLSIRESIDLFFNSFKEVLCR